MNLISEGRLESNKQLGGYVERYISEWTFADQKIFKRTLGWYTVVCGTKYWILIPTPHQ